MKTQILPNWCKKLGLAIFIIFSIIGGGDDFASGFNEGYNATRDRDEKLGNTEHKLQPMHDVVIFKDYFGRKTIHYFYAISFLGILMYMLSKEKIEDDYINSLRLESYKFTAIFGIIVSILLYAFSKEIKLGLDYFLSLFMSIYLIIFCIKKRLY
ncbi:hypothetical protein [Formosa sp. L2A11]|uniref:hypothetical protein n=1 Tax=Formosa sp. L2A11 TaxID=2686363 RepID=UPI00131DA538|nr:hypothetical protein [Formosa sp. L2A11]